MAGYSASLLSGGLIDEIIPKLKYLKTGNFIQELKTTIKPFVGSENQIFEEISKDETTK